MERATSLYRSPSTTKISLDSVSPVVFISYRRSDAAAVAARLYDELSRALPRQNVFIDFDTIEAGDSFSSKIETRLSGATVVLAVVGPRWLGRRVLRHPRLFDKADWVRKELAIAASRSIAIIPVLVDGAPQLKPRQLPREVQHLAARQSFVLRNSHWGDDIGILKNRVLSGALDTFGPPEWPSLLSYRQVFLFALVILLAVIFGGGLYQWKTATEIIPHDLSIDWTLWNTPSYLSTIVTQGDQEIDDELRSHDEFRELPEEERAYAEILRLPYIVNPLVANVFGATGDDLKADFELLFDAGATTLSLGKEPGPAKEVRREPTDFIFWVNSKLARPYDGRATLEEGTLKLGWTYTVNAPKARNNLQPDLFRLYFVDSKSKIDAGKIGLLSNQSVFAAIENSSKIPEQAALPEWLRRSEIRLMTDSIEADYYVVGLGRATHSKYVPYEGEFSISYLVFQARRLR